MNHPSANEMAGLAERLIAEEFRAGSSPDTKGRAAFRVCEKLRRSLSVFVGVAGFQSLLARALTLAKAKDPWLAGLQINPDGSFAFPAEFDAQLDTPESTRAGAALIATFLGLLVIFIGEILTLRLVQDIWPAIPLPSPDSDSAEKQKS
jgi:hypothetical protein